MTAFAGCGQAKSGVIENRCQVILLVAGIASGRQADELPGSRILVAIFALYEGMRANQRESILVILNRLQRNLPAFHRVAVRAIGSELAAMYVGVALRALRTYVFENQVRVAFAAAHVLVHAAQGIPGEIVIELRISPDRLPAGVGMAICARNGKRAVGIGYLGLGYAYACSYTGSAAGITGRFCARITGRVTARIPTRLGPRVDRGTCDGTDTATKWL